MQLVLVISAAVAVVSAALQEPKTTESGDDIRIINRDTVIYGEGNKFKYGPPGKEESEGRPERDNIGANIGEKETPEKQPDGVRKIAPGAPIDVNEIIHGHMSADDRIKLGLDQDQIMWYNRVLKKFVEAGESPQKAQNYRNLIFVDLNDEGRERLNYTATQNLWFADLLASLVERKEGEPFRAPAVVDVPTDWLEMASNVQKFPMSTTGTGTQTTAFSATGEAYFSSPRNKPSASSSRLAVTNRTIGEKFIGGGARAGHETWAVLGGLVAAGVLVVM